MGSPTLWHGQARLASPARIKHSLQCPRQSTRAAARASASLPLLAVARSNLLASCRDGCTEAIMLAHGFTIERMVKLVRVGLARATAERVVGGNRTIEIAQVWIIEAGRRALAPS
jgi:hypothetical protein